MDTFHYSEHFRGLVVNFLRRKEASPHLNDLLGGPNSRVIRFIKQLIPEIEYHCGTLNGKRILDFGCGMGASSAALTHYGGKVCAFDIDEKSIEICKQRIQEHGMKDRVQFYCADDIDKVKDSMGNFDLILMNGVIEHIPLSIIGLRKRIIKSLFALLNKGGYLFINDSPNRLYPIDFHTTKLWLIPWTMAGSEWAYRRAIKKGRFSNDPTNMECSLVRTGQFSLEEYGAWGITYWEIIHYLSKEDFTCVNLINGHNRHISVFSLSRNWKRTFFEFLIYYSAVKLFNIPITAFGPSINNLVLQKC